MPLRFRTQRGRHTANDPNRANANVHTRIYASISATRIRGVTYTGHFARVANRDNSRELAGGVRQRARESYRCERTKQDVGLYLRPRSKFSRQSRRAAIGSRCMYCVAASRPKIIYRRAARAARGAASDNRDRAGSSLSPGPFIGLSKLSGPAV